MSIGISSPWVQYVNQLKAMFGEDPEIRIEYNNDDIVVSLYVENQIKADALQQLLPVEKEFGNVKLSIRIIPANENQTAAMLFRNALNGNPAFNFVETVEGVMTNPITYVVFDRKVVQYYNDNLGDIYGNCTTLYQDIAKNIFEDKEGIYFCTDIEASEG